MVNLYTRIEQNYWILMVSFKILMTQTESCSRFQIFLAKHNDDDISSITFDTDITFDTNTEVVGSCAATLNGELWLIGGEYDRRQVKHNFLYWRKNLLTTRVGNMHQCKGTKSISASASLEFCTSASVNRVPAL